MNPPPQPHWSSSLRWPLTVLAVAVLALIGYRWTLDRAGEAAAGVAESAKQTIASAGSALAEIGARFQSGTITETFISSIPAIEGAGSGRLELATAEVTELLSISDERRVLWDLVSLGETASEIRVPVTYRYHLRFSDEWTITVRDQTVIVDAPKILPSLPPAIDTERMTRHVQQDWLRFNGEDQLKELEASLTPTLSRMAQDRRHMALVRESCRRTVAEFVRGWLLAEDHWGEERFRSIEVRFPDERIDAAQVPWALEWETE